MIKEQTTSLYLTSSNGESFTNPFFLILTLLSPKIAYSEKSTQSNTGVTRKTNSSIEPAQGCNALRAKNLVGPEEMWISPDAARQFASPYAYSPNPVNSVDPDGNLVENVNDNELQLMVNTLSDDGNDFYQKTFWDSKEVFQWSDLYSGFQAVENARTWIGTARNDDSKDNEGYLHDCSGMMCKILGLPAGWGSSTNFRALAPLPYTTLIPGQLLTYGSPGTKHVGMYDPLGGGKDYLLSMTGKNSKGAFQYRDPNGKYSPWKNEKAVGLPARR